MSAMRHSPLPVALIALCLLPTAAAAQVTSAAEPNSTSSASRLKLGVDGTAPPFGGRVPTSLRLLLDRGFALDLATPDICGDSAGRSNGGCPQYSQVAAGTAVVETSFLGGPATEATAKIDVYRSETTPAGALAGLLAIIDHDGVRAASDGVVRAVDDGPFGYEVRFDELATPSSFGTAVRLKRFDVDISATWRQPVTVARSVKCRQGSKSRSCKQRPDCTRGRRCARYRTVRETRLVQHHLLRNPAQCSGAWSSRTIAAFADGTSATVDAPIACTT